FLPSSAGVRLRITVRTATIAEAEARLRDVEAKIRAQAEKYIYAIDDTELEEVVGTLLAEKKLSLAVAESCTGGLIADRITNISGSSNYFERGIISYSNESKTQELHVPENLIQQYGAVSKEVAEAMAEGIRKTSGVNIGISTTGIAGPTGATQEKPIGLVWIGYSDAKSTFAIKFIFNGERRIVKERAAQAALELLRRKLLNISL
ncbi:MAG TPA: nicotinamide-nucleotide amidohydrolase family protein, partial [Bacteroidota bacterium]|nr:nicotinamide-nucleotide amidohydrolase family protein [Bacteroidota bacterium]